MRSPHPRHPMFHRRSSYLACALTAAAVVAAAVSGCDDETTGPCPENADAYADSPEEVLEMLLLAWEDFSRGPRLIDRILAEDYQFEFFQADVDTSQIYATYDRDQELLAHTNIFTGLPGEFPQPAGDLRQALIVLQPGFTLTPEDASAWLPRSDPPYEGTFSKSFKLEAVTVIYEDNQIDVDTIIGFHEFFVAREEVELGCGSTAMVYQLKNWRDKGFIFQPTKDMFKHRSFTWGYLRAVYGPKPPAP